MNQDADKPKPSTPDDEPVDESQEEAPVVDETADEAMVAAELDDDNEAAVDTREGTGDLDALAAMTRSDTFDADDFAATAARPSGVRRPAPKPKASQLKSAAVFPVMTIGLVLIGFAVYGMMLMNGIGDKPADESVMPKVMTYVAGPLGLIMEIIGVGLLLSVIDDNKKAKAEK